MLWDWNILLYGGQEPSCHLAPNSSSLFWETVNFLVLFKRVCYMATGQPHQYIHPLLLHRESKGSLPAEGCVQSTPVSATGRDALAARDKHML